MLSLFKLEDADRASDYYSKDNYYSKNDPQAEKMSSWFGRGAANLGLKGIVEQKQFDQILRGILPSGEVMKGKRIEDKLDPNKKYEKHRPGYDLTFSAPKSLSILLELGFDDRLAGANEYAVNKVLSHIENEVITTRIFQGGSVVRELTDNIVVAKYIHTVSRQLDPDTHIHCILMNMTMKDEKWRAICTEKLYEQKITLGTIYRHYLADYVVNQLGYEIEVTRDDGLFELKGVPKHLIMDFSKRRQEILRLAKEKGVIGVKALQNIVLSSRKTVRDVDLEKLVGVWRENIGDEFKGLEQTVNKATKQAAKLEKKAIKDKASGIKSFNRLFKRDSLEKKNVLTVIEHLSEGMAVFKHHDLIRLCLTAEFGKVSLDKTKSAIEALKHDGVLVPIHGERWTTKEMLELEMDNISRMRKGQSLSRSISKDKAIEKLLKGLDANDDQKQAIRTVLSSKDRYMAVQGYAGTGKTSRVLANVATQTKNQRNMVDKIAWLAGKSGYKVLGIAPTAKASRLLGDQANIEMQTVAKFLIDNEGTNSGCPKKTIVFVDESSMASSKQVNRIMKIADKKNLKIVFVGDPLQLSAIEAGMPLEQLINNGMQTTTLVKIERQKEGNEGLSLAIKETIDGNIEEAFEHLAGRVQKMEDKSKRFKAVAKSYTNMTKEERDETLVIVPAHEDRKDINGMIRQTLIAQKELCDQEKQCDVLATRALTDVQRRRAYNYLIGNMVCFNKSYTTLGIKAQEYFEVVKKNRKGNIVYLKRPGSFKKIKWNPEKRPANVSIYNKETRFLSKGDIIRWTKNIDRKLGQINSTLATIIDIKKNKATIELESGKTVKCRLDDNRFKHWDHGYAMTVHASQGTTKKNVIALLDSYRKNLISWASFYVCMSRAADNFMCFTDNKDELCNQILSSSGRNISAIDALNGDDKRQIKEPKRTKYKSQSNYQSQQNCDYAPQESSKLTGGNAHPGKLNNHKAIQQRLNKKMKSWDVDRLNEGLKANVEELAKQLLGEKNHKLSHGNNIRFGKKGAISIMTNGRFDGLWKNFETGESGNLLKLIQNTTGLGFKDALDYAGSFLGIQPETKTFQEINNQMGQAIKNKPVVIDDVPDEEDKKKMRQAKSLAMGSQKIEGTLAETYLKKHRKIEGKLPSSYRYHPAVFEPETKKKLPALLVLATNKTKEIEAVQTIYLDEKTANKADLLVKKRTFGRVRFGASVCLNQGKNANETYIVEGPETGLSILETKPDATIKVSLSQSNMAKVAHELSSETEGQKIVLCLDNDEDKKKNAVLICKNNFKDKLKTINEKHQISIIAPEKSGHDFNDVLVKEGLGSLKNALKNQHKLFDSKEKMDINNAKIHQETKNIVLKNHQNKQLNDLELDNKINQLLDEQSIEEPLENGFKKSRISGEKFIDMHSYSNDKERVLGGRDRK